MSLCAVVCMHHFFYDQLFGKEAAVCLSASSLAERKKVIPLMFTHSSYKEEEGICCMVGKYCCRLSVMKPSGGIGGLHVLFTVPYPTCTSTRYPHTHKHKKTHFGDIDLIFLVLVFAEPVWAFSWKE